jgi:hypothetical protein
MSSSSGDIRGKLDFEHTGIGEAISRRSRLRVPVNQREYKWEKEHVVDLLQDFTKSIRGNRESYFLGTVVLTGADHEVPQIVDGQQRLATTTILLAALRDYLYERDKNDILLQHIENQLLFSIVPETRSISPRLTLNVDDHEFFKTRILLRPDNPERMAIRPTKPSHHRIELAATLSRDHVATLLRPSSDRDRLDEVNRWLRFIEYTAQVIVLRVPDGRNAYRMFETLNDRGLKTNQADLLKNYLFGEAEGKAPELNRLVEAQQRWAAMTGALDSLDVADEATVIYLRHLLSSLHGLTRENEVYEAIQSRVSGQGPSLSFLATLAECVNDYVALYNPEHVKWNDYDPKVRNAIRTLNHLQPGPIRPLMLAIARHFPKAEAEKAFRMFVSWVVRFLIYGGARSGNVEEAYSERAKEVTEGKVTTASSLVANMGDVLPSDAQFKAAFGVARVSKNSLARYYLRALELKAKNDPAPDLIPNDDPLVVNLEHVLPEHPSSGWGHIAPEIASAFYKRIGNMALLKATSNSIIGNNSFEDKKIVLGQSGLVLTREIASQLFWGPDEINRRQEKLAELAVRTWPLTLT